MIERPATTHHPANPSAPGQPTRVLRLGFARGVAPSKWARRWAQSTGGDPRLELLPFGPDGRPQPDPAADVLLERVAPGSRPAGSEPGGDRRAVRLYVEGVALVVPADHELADADGVDASDLALVRLLDHPDHAEPWPRPEPWADPSWAPTDAASALQIVGTGAGAILLSLPLARHLAGKRAHAVIPVRPSADGQSLPGTEIWASWAAERDAADVQLLIGILRGRTARSGRAGSGSERAKASGGSQNGGSQSGGSQSGGTQPKASARRGTSLPKNSRGAQLAAARAKRGKRRGGSR